MSSKEWKHMEHLMFVQQTTKACGISHVQQTTKAHETSYVQQKITKACGTSYVQQKAKAYGTSHVQQNTKAHKTSQPEASLKVTRSNVGPIGTQPEHHVTWVLTRLTGPWGYSSPIRCASALPATIHHKEAHIAMMSMTMYTISCRICCCLEISMVISFVVIWMCLGDSWNIRNTWLVSKWNKYWGNNWGRHNGKAVQSWTLHPLLSVWIFNLKTIFSALSESGLVWSKNWKAKGKTKMITSKNCGNVHLAAGRLSWCTSKKMLLTVATGRMLWGFGTSETTI